MNKKEVYCVKCREAVTPEHLEKEKDARGRARLHGICPHCHTHCYKYTK